MALSTLSRNKEHAISYTLVSHHRESTVLGSANVQSQHGQVLQLPPGALYEAQSLEIDYWLGELSSGAASAEFFLAPGNEGEVITNIGDLVERSWWAGVIAYVRSFNVGGGEAYVNTVRMDEHEEIEDLTEVFVSGISESNLGLYLWSRPSTIPAGDSFGVIIRAEGTVHLLAREFSDSYTIDGKHYTHGWKGYNWEESEQEFWIGDEEDV